MKFFQSKIGILLLVVVFTASLGACANRPLPETTETGERVFRLGFSDTPSSLNPYTADTEEAAAAIALLYDTLFYADIETGRYINSVCLKYTVQDAAADGARLWSLTLRSDVTFHDGTVMTARDVEFSLQSMKDFSHIYGYPDCELIDTTGISVTDDTHISFLAWGDVAAVEECLSRVPIVPRSVWNALDGMEYSTAGIPKNAPKARETLESLIPSAETMVGSGLYIWGSYENGILTLRRNENYWNGTASAEVVELHFGVEDLASSIENNEIDAAWNLSGSAAKELSEGRSSAHGTSGELLLLEINQRTDSASEGNALLRDKIIREAISLCTDRETLAAAFGGAVPSNGFSIPYESEESESFVYSTDDAAALLDSAGYTDNDGDGIRESEAGERLSFRILCSDSSSGWLRAVNILRNACADAGIELEIIALSPEKSLSMAKDGDFDIYLTAVQSYYDAYLSLASYYWNDGAGAYWNGTASPGWNISGYANDAFDALYEELTFTSAGERETLEKEMEEFLQSDCAAVPIAFAAKNQVCRGAWLRLRRDHGEGLFFTPAIFRQQLQDMSFGNA